ncbi:MAG: hypothetical protein WC708_02195 [Lentisphaeria bacterium]
MERDTELTQLVHDLTGMVVTTAGENRLGDAEVRRVLAFVSQVIQVVEQAFQDVLTLMLDIQYLDQSELGAGRLIELRKRVELLTARSYYRDAAEICSRLKHLRENFDEFIKPSVRGLSGFNEWRGVFGLIEEREGRIVMLMQHTAHEISQLLDKADEGQLSAARTRAGHSADQLRGLLAELHGLNGKILGLSGRSGFLELTRDRNELRREVNLMVDARDQSITHGPRVSVGNGNTFQHEFVVAGSIHDSFNRAKDTSDQELRAKLQELCKHVEQMTKQLSEETTSQVTQDLSTFVAEVSRDKPRRKWYELSGEGLIEAAKTCAGMASPVVKTVKEILSLLAIATEQV